MSIPTITTKNLTIQETDETRQVEVINVLQQVCDYAGCTIFNNDMSVYVMDYDSEVYWAKRTLQLMGYDVKEI